MTSMIINVTDLLGGKNSIGRNLESKMDFWEVTIKGLTKRTLDALANYLSFSQKDFAKLISISPKTLQRYKEDQKLNSNISENVLKIAELVAKGVNVFGSKDKFLAWLQNPNLALYNKKPIDLLENKYGLELVFDELIRIEYGIFS
jgi:putative toxin-antitoxin system antitoxin component (TIGR02293 family)